ncbi:hypothetical protein JCM10213_005080 [Rhodosporidiobolus nylandii]
MLDRLPVELLDHIFDLIRWPYADKWNRRRPLAACCLVCRRCREVAQPQLWREIHCSRSGSHATSALRSLAAVNTLSPLWRHVRVLEMGLSSGGLARAEEVAQRMINLEELALTLRAYGSDDICGFPSLSKLRVLHLNSATPPPTFFSAPLPSLQGFTLAEYFPDSTKTVSQIFTPAIFPSLRALSIGGRYIGDEVIFAALEGPLLAQLEMVNFDFRFLPVIPGAVLRGTTPVLVSIPPAELFSTAASSALLAAGPAHVSLLNDFLQYDDEEFEEALAAINVLIALVRSPSRPLSLHLPSELKADEEDVEADEDADPLHTELYDGVKELTEACKEEKVEVAWHWDNSVGISPNFWAYAKKLKTAQQASGET